MTQLDSIYNDERFQTLLRRRTRLRWCTAIATILCCSSIALMTGFAGDWFSQPLWSGAAITRGLAWSVAIVILVVIIELVYVWRSQRTYDRLQAELIRELGLSEADDKP